MTLHETLLLVGAPLHERLKHAMQLAGKANQSELAREVGVKPQAIQYLLDPKNNAVGSKHMTKLAEVLGVRANWLATGLGPMKFKRDDQLRTDFVESFDQGPDRRDDVPLISWVQAGTWNPASDPLQPGEAERWMPCIARHSPSTFALRVRGDSMTASHGNSKSYPEGSIIFVDPELRSPVNGQRVIAKLLHTEDVTFKVFKEEDGRRWLAPLNPTHEPIKDDFAILGTVIGKWEDD